MTLAPPTRAYLTAKSYPENKFEESQRTQTKLFFFVLAALFAILWLTFNPRVRTLLEQAGVAKLLSAAEEPSSLFDSPKAPIWLLLGMVLDFFGKAVRVMPQNMALAVHRRVRLAALSACVLPNSSCSSLVLSTGGVETLLL